MGLRTKLILLVLCAQVLAAVFMFVFSLMETRAAINEDLNQRGKLLARMLSLIDPDYIKEAEGSRGLPRYWLKKHFATGENEQEGELYSAYYDLALAAARNEEGGSEKARKRANEYARKAVDRIDEAFDQLIDSTEDPKKKKKKKKSLEREKPEAFLHPLIEGESALEFIQFQGFNSETGQMYTIMNVPSTQPTLNKGSTEENVITEPDDYDLRVLSNRMTIGTRTMPVRIFEIKRRPGNPENRLNVRLYFNSKEISEAAGRLTSTLLIVAGLAVLFGGVAGWLFSGKIIQPIEALLEDINTVSEGNLDHETVPESEDEIGVIARAFDRMTGSLKRAQEREIEARALEHELSIAMDVQNELLPKQKPQLNNWNIDAFYKPSKEVGGDYYDFIRIDEDRLGIVVADVSGKGVPGSMVMTMTRAMIRMEATRNPGTTDTLIRTNRMLSQDVQEGMFVTCMYVILNTAKNRLRISSAGHNPLVLWREEKGKIHTVNPNGIALGFDEGPLFEETIEESVLSLNRGDRFVLYTDGVVEAMSMQDEEFGDRQFYRLCGQFADQDANQFTNIIVQEVADHQGRAEQHDDITIVNARRMS